MLSKKINSMIIDMINEAEYADAHTHLDSYKSVEIPEVVEEIIENKIFSLSNSMNIASYEENCKLADLSNFIIPCFGIHPWEVKEDGQYDWGLIENKINESVMVGEIGLDFYWVEDKNSYDKQLEVFEKLVKLSAKYGKPMNIHTKGGEKEVLNILKMYSPVKVIIHWYSGPTELIHEFIQLNCRFTISLDVMNNSLAKEICERIPITNLLAETDNPDANTWLYGKKGMPCDILKVYEQISAIKGISLDYTKCAIKDNLISLFKDS